MMVVMLKVAKSKIERGGWGTGGSHTLRRRSLAVWMSSSLGFSLKVPRAHSSATCIRWQQPRDQAAGISSQEGQTLFPPSP